MDPWLRELVDSGRDRVPVVGQLVGPEPAELTVTARIGDVVAGSVDSRHLEQVNEHQSVARLGGAREYLDPVIDGGGDEEGFGGVVATGGSDRVPANGEASGSGVVIGVADWGLDITHPAFRRPDGHTRIESFWDQAAPHDGNPYGLGAIHSRDMIDAALRQADPHGALGHDPARSDPTDSGSHGTHVLSIAAGSRHAGEAAGVAPDADLVFVHLAPTSSHGLQNLGDSAAIVEALHFVGEQAGDRPVVFSLSAGRTSGAHNGSSLVERAFDLWVAERPGRAIVQSAGNYRRRNTHGLGRVMAGRPIRFDWEVKIGDRTPNEAEIWYSPEDRLAVRAVDPDGRPSDWVELDAATSLADDNGRSVCRIVHRDLAKERGSRVANVFLSTGARDGRWAVEVAPRYVVDGTVHVWVERDGACRDCQSTLTGPLVSDRFTVGTIATARHTIAVGAYDPRTGEMAPFSSAGMSRDGRQKPEVVAPGAGVIAARSRASVDDVSDRVTAKSGTSMAAPFVAGQVARLFEAALPERLPIETTRSLLFAAAHPLDNTPAELQGAGLVHFAHADPPEGTDFMATDDLTETALDQAAQLMAADDRDPVLAGPIIRRATRSGVHVWIATNQEADVKGSILVGDREVGRSTYNASRDSVKVGENLYIHCIRIDPADSSFPMNTVLEYDVWVESERAGRTAHATRAEAALGLPLGVRTRPSFILSSRSTANFLHGSCRKLHNRGPDALAQADRIISATASSASDRPQALFLTGDQVYADDVDPSIRRWATALGRALIGDEQLPGVAASGLAGDRQAIVERFGFSGESIQANHVLRLGEYIALHLMAWNDGMWHDSIPARHRNGVAEVRRALANIPTYMIFDDHEITDDWNLTSTQSQRWARSRFARRVLGNGLAAYWLFQGWGNDPARFGPGNFPATTASFVGGSVDARERELLGRPRQGMVMSRTEDWGYVAPTTPPVVVLDTRTHRRLDADGGPGLIRAGSPQSRWRRATSGPVAAATRRGWPLIVVSPAPLLGFEIVELLQRAVGTNDAKAREFDHEAWVNGGREYLDVIRALGSAEAPYVVVLSGDVHYASTIAADVAVRGSTRPVRIVQLTSSPSKNRDQKATALALATNELVRTGSISGRTINRILAPFLPEMLQGRSGRAAARSLVQFLMPLVRAFLLPHRTVLGWLDDPRRIPAGLVPLPPSMSAVGRALFETTVLAARPIVLPPQQAKSFGLRLGTADWSERRATIRSNRRRVIVDDTNIGRVRISRTTGRVRHELHLGSGVRERFEVSAIGPLPTEGTPAPRLATRETAQLLLANAEATLRG